MESISFLNFFFVSLVAYLGLAFGLLISFAAPEEIVPGRKYFAFARKMMYIIIAAISIYFLYNKLIVAPIIFLSLLCAFYAKIFYSHYLQLFLALIFAVSSVKTEFFVIAASLIFIFNMLSPALWLDNIKGIEKLKTKEKFNVAKVIMRNNLLFFVCLLFYFLIKFMP